MITPHLLHYLSAAFALSIASIGGGIGQGLAGAHSIMALRRQSLGHNHIFRAMIIGLALIESGIIISLVMTLITLFSEHNAITWAIALSEVGISLAIGIAAAATSIASSFVVSAATKSISRQPFFAQKIITLMLLSQSIIEAPIVFAFIISLLIRGNFSPSLEMIGGIKHLAIGILMALGSIGPSIGQGLFAYAACTSVGKNRRAYDKIFPFALLSEAVIETPMIFCLLLSLIILYIPTVPTQEILQGTSIFTAAFTLGIGSMGTAIGIGHVASRSCYQIAQEPNNYSIIVRTTLLVEAFIESAVIYAMIIALLLIMKTS